MWHIITILPRVFIGELGRTLKGTRMSCGGAALLVSWACAAASACFSEIENFVLWCDANHLILNVKKTEEMALDQS